MMEANAAAEARRELAEELLAWVDERIEAEVTHRPDTNRYNRTLTETWNQVKARLLLEVQE